MLNGLPEPPDELLAELRQLVSSEKSIAAIKAYRGFAKCGLSDAKEWMGTLVER